MNFAANALCLDKLAEQQAAPFSTAVPDAAALEEMEEKGRAFDRDRAAAALNQAKDPAIEAERERLLAELDELLKLGRRGVIKKRDRELSGKMESD